MIAQDRLSTSPFSEKDTNIGGRQVPMDHFLKEAVQILWHANMSIAGRRQHQLQRADDNPSDGNHDNDLEDDDSYQAEDDDDNSVAWKLNLSPSLMTLDTNIQTVTGLEKVLEQLATNVQPRPTPTATICRPGSSDHYDMDHFINAIAESHRLSAVVIIPRTDVFRQCNSMQLIRQCVQIFVMCGGALFLDVPRLMAETDMVLSHPAAAKEHPVETLLILSICCAMVRHVTIHQRGHPGIAAGLMHTYYMQARLLLQDLFDIQHINVIRAQLLLSLFPHSHTDLFTNARTWSPLLSMAVRSAMAMDLHKLDLQDNDESEQKERLRRLAWIVLCADHFADWNESSQKSGRINVNDWHVNFPQPLPGEHNTRQVEWFSQYCRVVMIRKMHLFRSAYMVVQHSPQALEESMDEKLFQTYLKTPDFFELDPDSLSGRPRQWVKDDLESLLLRELYCNTLIQAHIPFLPQRYLVTLKGQESLRAEDLKGIYQQLVQSSGQAAFVSPLPNTFCTSTSSQTPHSDPHHPRQHVNNRQELHCVAGCLAAANTYTLVLEALATIDPIGCRHSPVFGAMMTTLVYQMVQANCHDANVVTVCRTNLGRTLRILNQARTVYPDSTILYLQRVLTRLLPTPLDEDMSLAPQRTSELIQTFRSSLKKEIPHGNDLIGIKSEPL